MPAMGSVWKRLQRVNKRAAKFQFTASYHELCLETTAKWRPSNLSVVWTRRSRRVASAPLPWEPDMMNPLVGHVTWPVPDNHAISVTLFKDPRTHELEDKDWTFVIEDISALGKKRVLANASINMRKYASIESTQQSFTLSLKPVSRKITAADLELTISCVFLREGKATDEDMQSVVSLMSVNNNFDVAPLDDLEDIPDLENSADISDHLYDFTHQLEQMTTSLNGCMDLPTPLSVPSLSEDPTPLAEVNNLNFELESDKREDDKTVTTTTTTTMITNEQAEGEVGILQEDTLKTPSAAGTLPTASSSSSTLSTTQQQQQNHHLMPQELPTANILQQQPQQQQSKDNFTTQRDKQLNKIFTSTPKIKATTAATAAADDKQNEVKEQLWNNSYSKARKSLTFSSEKALKITTTTTATTTPSGKEENETSVKPLILNDKNKATDVNKGKSMTLLKDFNKTLITSTKNNTQETKEAKLEDHQTSATEVKDKITTEPQKPSTKRPALQPLNLKKSYESMDNTSNQQQQQQQFTSTNITTTTTSSSINNTTTTTTTNATTIANGHITGISKPIEKIILKENTPGQDLLEWCKDVTKDYPNVKVTNLTTSWRNGMAFCAIIHHYQSALIDMSKLTPHDVVGNCRIAFDAAESLGIPRVIEPRDMSLLAVPDKLAVMTYLHQLRAHFTGKQLQIEQIGPTSDESSYVIGNYKTDNLSSQNLLNLSHLKAQLLHQNSLDEEIYSNTDKSQTSPTAKKDVKNFILSGSKNILGKVLSPAKDKNNINASQHSNLNNLNMPLTSPLIEDNHNHTEMENGKLPVGQKEKENVSFNSAQETEMGPASPTILDPYTTNKILSRHKEQSEKARLMMEKLKISQIDKNLNDEERQQRLREQARRLILEARNKTSGGSSLESPASPTKINKRNNFTPERNISSINNGGMTDEYSVQNIINTTTTTITAETSDNTTKLITPLTPTKKLTPSRDVENITNLNSNNSNKLSPSHRLSERFINGNSPLQSFNAVMERISPKNEKKPDKLSYIESELEALEREQEAIDQKASSLEKKLRAVMGGNPSNKRSSSRNPFLRLIRNSIGGGETIRIKLLDLENGEFSLTPSGSSSNTSTSSSPTSDDDDINRKQRTSQKQKQQQKHQEEQCSFNKRPIPPPRRIRRQRSRSCFVESNKIKSNHSHTLNTNQPYSLLSSNSSNHSSCDNFQICSDEDGNVPLRVKRRHKRRHRSRPQPQKHNKQRSSKHGHCNGGETEETEEQLLSQWFTLVNKKNALLRRQMQLNILEQESDLERKYTMLNQELRAAQSVEDWRKTEAQREKENLLLEELVAIVDKRNELVQRLHNEEIAIEDDHEIARELEQVDISGGKEKCVIQ